MKLLISILLPPVVAGLVIWSLLHDPRYLSGAILVILFGILWFLLTGFIYTILSDAEDFYD